MTKINLNSSPYFDDFNESKKFYKVLFRPGRSVQARELNQIQSILQNQVAKLGGFSQGDLVHPTGLIGARYNNTTVFLKVVHTDNTTSLIANETQLNMHWLGKYVTNADGVKGKVIGYDITGNVVRFFIDLVEAGKTTKNFRRGDTISIVNGNLSFKGENSSYATGRISKVNIPESIYFYNGYYVLVDEQTLFLTPDNKNNDADWNTSVTFDAGIKMTESIVRYDQDETLLDNAAGSSNYGGAGADRLKIEGLLVKRQRQTIEQNFIRILSIEKGLIVDAPLVERENLGVKSESEARRIYEESGNYTVTPFLANALPFLSTEDEDGLYSELSELSFGYTEEDGINIDQARAAALELAKNLFKMQDPQVVNHNNRFYPGTSYDDTEETSFVNLCDSMVGIRVEPGVAYVQGYRAATAGTSKVAVKKARSSDFQPLRKIQTPIGQYILITNVFGSPEISNEGWPYDDIELHSAILDLSSTRPNLPAITTKIGTARVCSINLQSGSSGSSTATYQLGIFDIKIDDGYTYDDVKSIYSNGRSTSGKDFLANLVLKNSAENPWIIFDGTVEKIANPYSAVQKQDSDASTTDNPNISLVTGNTAINLDFSKLATRDECYSKLTLGTAIKINNSNLVRVITDIKKLEDASQIVADQEFEIQTPGSNTAFTMPFVPNVDSVKVYLGSSTTPATQQVAVEDFDGTGLTGSSVWVIDGSNYTYALPHRPIEDRNLRVVVTVDNELLNPALINGVNRTFPIRNPPKNNAVKVYKRVGSNSTAIEAKYYQVANGKLTFINLLETGENKIPQANDVIYLNYETYIYSTDNKKILLSQAPVINSTIKVTYSYNQYTVDNQTITFAVTPPAYTKVVYDYMSSRRVQITLDEAVRFNNSTTKIERLDVVKKIIGKGTTWKSNTLQSVSKGDWVQIGTDSNKKLYRVFSTPTNDNELNLDPDPMEISDVNGTKTFINAPWPDGTKMTYLVPEDIRDMRSYVNCGLVYKLPHKDIRTIRGGTKNAPDNTTSVTYTARRYRTVTSSGNTGNITIEVDTTKEDVLPFSSNLYSLVDLNTGFWFQLFDSNTPDQDAIGSMDPDRPETFKAKVVVNSDSTASKNVVFKVSPSAGDRMYVVCMPVTKRLKEGVKTLKKGGFVGEEYTNGVSAGEGAAAGFVVTGIGSKNVTQISLGVPDVVNVTRIVVVEDPENYSTVPTSRRFNGPSWTGPDGKIHRDITGLYTLNTGQTDYYYGIASVRLRSNMPIPQGRVRVEFDYYQHPDQPFDYFSVDSYTASGISYHQIPMYTSSAGDPFDLTMCLDFRPVVDIAEQDGKKVFLSYKETPISDLVCSYHVYEERKDLLYVSKNGELEVKQGTPALDAAFPSEAIDGMTLYTISISPYTTTMADVMLKMVDNRRYTMKDISLLEKRIKNVEHYTSLNLLEKSTKDLVIKDSLGQDKYKHGFMTDTFENFVSADLKNQEYSAATDTRKTELKPPIQITHIPLIESVLLVNSENSVSETIQLQEAKRAERNYARADKNTPSKKSSLYTLRYDNVTFIEQPICSRVININPYAVQSFVGSLKINPWTDTWRDLVTAKPRYTYDSTEYDRLLKNYNSNKERIDWGTTQKEILGVTDSGEVPDGRVNLLRVNSHYPVDTKAGGKYLIQITAKDPETGKNVIKWVPGNPQKPTVIEKKGQKRKGPDGKYLKDPVTGDYIREPSTFTYKPGTQYVKIPEGYPGAGQVVTFGHGPDVDRAADNQGFFARESNSTLLQNGYSRTITTTAQEFKQGSLSRIVDMGFVESVRIGNKIIETAAATNIRQRQIQFDGKGFFPNTRLYAFFDNQDVTAYCVPDRGFGSVEDEPSNKVFRQESISLKYGKDFISTGTSSAAANLCDNFTFEYIKSTTALNFALLEGKVTTQGTKLVGAYSEMTLPSTAPYTTYANFSIAPGDIIQGRDTGARGVVKSISSDLTKIYFDALTKTAFDATGETIEIKNDETIVVLKETPTKNNDYTYVLQNTPIAGQGSEYQPLKVYLIESVTGSTPAAPITHDINSSEYTITENTRTIKFVYNKSPQEHRGWQNRSSEWSILVDYTYEGSNYYINNEVATLSPLNATGETKKFDVNHVIIPGTLTVTFTGGTVNPIPTFTTSSSTITFSANIPSTVTVTVKYSTPTQVTFGKQIKSGTKFLTELVAKTATAPGSVLTFSSTTEEREIIQVVNNAEATMASALSSNITVAGGVECADKLEALQKTYLSKFVDIFGANSIENNILNTKINAITYKPESTTDKLTFHFDTSMIMTSKVETVELYIKNTPTQAGATDVTTVILKCNASGSIKGRFCIPDPKISGNPTFPTGDKTFRLTDSAKNENLPSVSRADAGYSARGWIDTQAEDVLMVKRWDIEKQDIKTAGETTTYSQVFKTWGEICPADPIAQSFTVREESGVFITAVDIFFYSKDPYLPVRLEIRPLADGGQPSTQLLYRMSLESDDVVVNKVNLKDGTVTVYGAKGDNAQAGFNKGPWNTFSTQDNGIYTVNSYAYEKGMSYTINDGNNYTVPAGGRNPAAVEYGFGTDDTLKNAQSHMIPTRFVLEYPLHLQGGNRNYCFVLLSDSIPGDQAGGNTEILESTYQVYFAQQGKVYDHQTLATPVHRQAPLLDGEEDINLVLGTGEVITRIPQADGQIFKSQNGVSWIGDPVADLKFKIHKAKFDTTRSGEITFVNDGLEYAELNLSPFETRAGSSRIRVSHNNHNFCVGSYVSFVDVQGDLNGIMPQQIIEPKVHQIEFVTVDSYIIDLGGDNIATFDGNVGGANVKASTNIRFEEIALVANPLIVDNTNITWRLAGLRGAGPDDIEGQQSLYDPVEQIQILPNLEEATPVSMVVCSDKNEKEFNPINENEEPWEQKSLKIIATLSSTNENISPIIDSDRVSAIAKTVRLNDPYGVGVVNNINNPLFDSVQVLPSSLVPGSVLPRQLYFSDTDSNITGSEFEINYRTITGVGSIFTVELLVGDTLKCPINSETRRIVEILSDTELTIDAPFTVVVGTRDVQSNPTPNVFNVKSLSANPPQLRFKTSDLNIAAELRKISVGKYLSLSGTFNGDRDFFEKKVVSLVYTPTNTTIDPELGAPKLCEVVVEHTLRDGVEAGLEVGSEQEDITLTLLNGFVDDISTSGTSSASKYICKEMSLANPANTLKIMFDGCRPEGSEIALYYMTQERQENSRDSKIWKKLDYSIEEDGVLKPSTPQNDPNHHAFSSYEANEIMIRPFIGVKIKIVLRGGNCARYPKVKNLRVIALEE